jgi:hypothetical protein
LTITHSKAKAKFDILDMLQTEDGVVDVEYAFDMDEQLLQQLRRELLRDLDGRLVERLHGVALVEGSCGDRLRDLE